MLKKNTLHTITCALFVALILNSCQHSDLLKQAESNKAPKALETFYSGDITKIDSLEIMSGSDGYTKNTTDSRLIQDWIEKIRHLNIILDPELEDTSGVLFHVTMFKQGKAVFYMTPTDINHQQIEPQDELADLMTELYQTIYQL
ncbi:hypothetical protein HUB98_15965 [Paenibacillus barcinonensis]|uniref:Uncharacterized protein n=1 Tax=Paenibacillus barcinonensis TaxID=198119 RepID=A0A2V4UY84_PAEBA|nr:hypothetical protein [Paenibacillus barcinonensis]PYE44279.1 hypothetical protein DFQ00_12556 [Paenibacillus barcinonensis]QKS57649.1 hypothetical protein HUB98_15965 [Paenibacillus barcinonensis]